MALLYLRTNRCDYKLGNILPGSIKVWAVASDFQAVFLADYRNCPFMLPFINWHGKCFTIDNHLLQTNRAEPIGRSRQRRLHYTRGAFIFCPEQKQKSLFTKIVSATTAETLSNLQTKTQRATDWWLKGATQ
ncbi:MAG: hypothetical protein M0023_05445 [Desulfobacteraceae bacterium]|nr:hypothetical protein [Desulfobacteraceae bacterium]